MDEDPVLERLRRDDGPRTIQVENGQPAGVPTLIRRSIGPVTPMGLTRTGAFYYRTPGSFMDVHSQPRSEHRRHRIAEEGTSFLEGHNRMPDWSPDGKNRVRLNAARRKAGHLHLLG
jgi:Tol biopolymer transport system component